MNVLFNFLLFPSFSYLLLILSCTLIPLWSENRFFLYNFNLLKPIKAYFRSEHSFWRISMCTWGGCSSAVVWSVLWKPIRELVYNHLQIFLSLFVCLLVLPITERVVLGAGLMAQWVRMLSVQARGPEFWYQQPCKNQARLHTRVTPPQSPCHSVRHRQKDHWGSLATSQASPTPHSLRDPVTQRVLRQDT